MQARCRERFYTPEAADNDQYHIHRSLSNERRVGSVPLPYFTFPHVCVALHLTTLLFSKH